MKKYFNAFNLVEDITPVRFQRIYSFFPSLEYAWEKARPSEFRRAGLESKFITKLLRNRLEIDPDTEFAKLEKLKISVVTKEDEAYPASLKEIHSAPFLLYFRGELPQNTKYFSVVGTRNCTYYGKKVTRDFTLPSPQAGRPLPFSAADST